MGVRVQYCSCFGGAGGGGGDGLKFNCTLSNGWLTEEEEMNTNTVNTDNTYLVLICSDTTYGHAIWYACTTDGKQGSSDRFYKDRSVHLWSYDA